MMAAPILLLGVGAGLWFTGTLPRLLGMDHAAQETAEAAKPLTPIYIDLPEMIANLNGNPQRPSYVKISARVEVLKADDAEKVKAALPKLQDLFLTYIREMRPEELRGSAGTYRLREELLARANLAATPARVTDVLFTQMLIQ
jgi:flagellar FliL protein